jgi:hypothetical protein
MTGHWLGAHETPHVWLLQNQDWGGRGWAASSPDDSSLFFLSTITPHVPSKHLQVFLAHEFYIHWASLRRADSRHAEFGHAEALSP